MLRNSKYSSYIRSQKTINWTKDEHEKLIEDTLKFRKKY